MKKIKVGIIGTGFIGETHIDALRRVGYVEVSALAENNMELARQKAEKNCIPNYYDDYHKLLEDPEIEVIHNCTPNYLHTQINLDIIASGKHVLSEKPLSLNAGESKLLVEAAKKVGVVNGVNFNYRQYPLVREMKNRIGTGDAGRIFFVHGHYLQDWLLNDTDYNWRLNPKAGGQSIAIADIGSHWCDLVQTVTGKKIVEVMADLGTAHSYRKSNSQVFKIDADDYGGIMVRFEDGTKGIFNVSQVSAGRKNCLSLIVDCQNYSMEWCQEDPERLWIGYRSKANESLMRDASLLSDNARPYCHLPGGHGEAWYDGLKNNMLNFYEFIRSGKTPETHKAEFATFEDGHRIMCIIDAILQSSKEQKWVKVNYI